MKFLIEAQLPRKLGFLEDALKEWRNLDKVAANR